MYYIIGLGSVAALAALAVLAEMTNTALINRALDLGGVAFREYLLYSRLFEEWRTARPLLCVRQCSYAMALVTAMIASYERYVAHRELTPQMEENLNGLRLLLEETPPNDDPPSPVFRGLVLVLTTGLFTVLCLQTPRGVFKMPRLENL